MKYLPYITTISLLLTLTASPMSEATEMTSDSVVITTDAEESASQSVNAASEEDTFDIDAYYEELVKQYGGNDYERLTKLQKRFEGDKELREEAAMKRKQNRLIAIIMSLLVALLPAIVILKQVIKGEIKPAGGIAVLKTTGILLFWGALLFGINYFWLLTTLNGETEVMGVAAGVLLLALVVYAVYTVSKYNKKHKNSNNEQP